MIHIASSSNLLEEIRNQFPKMAQEEGRLFFLYHHEVAHTKRLAGDLNGSEEILRDLLSRYEASMSILRRFRIMRELAEILNETDT
jgi:hypothetical protein